ncbi:MAG TPA: hypothetical protein ENN23_02910 [Deltaproteobacteria bacterium]|nr:hypothetical protein [Deltaproteobacteria bacterium]
MKKYMTILALGLLIFSFQAYATSSVNILMTGVKCLGEPNYMSVFNLSSPMNIPFLVITASNFDIVKDGMRLKIMFDSGQRINYKIEIESEMIKDFWIDIEAYLHEGLNMIQIISLDTQPKTITQVGFFVYYSR